MKTLLLAYIKFFAQVRLRLSRPFVVGVTGSVGKSSFTHLLYALMKEDRPTKATLKGNSESGLPLEILDLRDLLDAHPWPWLNWLQIVVLAPLQAIQPLRAKLLIAEMGIDSTRPPQNMEYLLEIVQPDIGVFLSVAPVHTQQFAEELGLDASDSAAIVAAIAHEKGKLVTTLPATATAVVSVDSPEIQKLAPEILARVINFGQKSGADFRVSGWKVSLQGTRFTLSWLKEQLNLDIPGYVLSEEYGNTLAAVIATAVQLGLSFEQIVARLPKIFHLPPGRMSLVSGKQGSTILDSSYNSSPAALRAVLKAAKALKVSGRKILVLGDMRELGPLEAEEHRALAGLIAETADQVILVGPKMRQYVFPELKKQKVSVHSTLSSLNLGKELLSSSVKSGDLIVVKGSQNTIFLEQTVLELMAEPELAKKVLCRQGQQWDTIRQAFWQSLEREK